MIFRIARKIAHEHFFLAGDPEIEQQKKNGRQKQRPPRAERERRANDKKERAEIHRMTHETVHTGVNDALAFFHAHVGGRIGIDLRHEIEKIEGERDERVANDRNVPRYGRPAEAIVERGQNDERDKRRKNKEDNDFLRRFFFVRRACLLASLQKSGVVFYEIDRIECRSKNGRTDICPTLPIIERTGRDEHHGAQRQRA